MSSNSTPVWTGLRAGHRILRRTCRLSALVLAGLVLGSCSWKYAYLAGRSYQGNECQKLKEQDERERCLKDADMSYEDYRRATE